MTGLMSSGGNGVGASWESSLKLRLKQESVLLPRKHPSVWHRVSLHSFGWLLSVCHFLTLLPCTERDRDLEGGSIGLCRSKMSFLLVIVKLVNSYERLGNGLWESVGDPRVLRCIYYLFVALPPIHRDCLVSY